ncbi:MAG TPA: hypothetical protein VK606_05255 [Verrucomicrobiae bacterium]|jgi:hypothetical protein|nr:hypothetical protein [Verrucomicrobiae bacterium]
MSRDGEHVIELINELGSRIGHLLSDMVPPRAQVHLLNAQRELITALMLIYEHRVTAAPGERTRRSPAAGRSARDTTGRRRPTKRAGKIPIE